MAQHAEPGKPKLVESGKMESVTWSTDANSRPYFEIQLNIDVDLSRHIIKMASDGGGIVGYDGYGAYWYLDEPNNKVLVFAGSVGDNTGKTVYQIQEVPPSWIVEQGVASVSFGDLVTLDTEIQLNNALLSDSYIELYHQDNYNLVNQNHCTGSGVALWCTFERHATDPSKLVASCRGRTGSGAWSYAPYCVVTPK